MADECCQGSPPGSEAEGEYEDGIENYVENRTDTLYDHCMGRVGMGAEGKGKEEGGKGKGKGQCNYPEVGGTLIYSVTVGSEGCHEGF